MAPRSMDSRGNEPIRNRRRPRSRLLLASAALALLTQCSSKSTTTLLGPHFEKVTLNADPGEPMGLAVLADGRVLHTSRRGTVWLYDPNTRQSTVAAQIPLYLPLRDEDGLQGIAVDPDFADNHWVYLYHSPPLSTPLDDPLTPGTDEGAAPAIGDSEAWAPFAGVMRLSRFELQGGALAMDSEQVILEVAVDRGFCCHVGGQIDFDSHGNLYLSTGDDSNPFQSDGRTPIDERPEQHPAFDAQRSAGNTNDLRGKLLRIRVDSSGGYSIPNGNLFAEGTANTRPEIYAMGLRNPFRFAVNRENNDVYLADYSPDAQTADPTRGPAGTGKWTVVREPGNYGWPYCATPDLPYVDYNFATGQAGEPFDCEHLINDSPNNTGLRELPPTVQPDLWYSFSGSARFPELGSGQIGPMAGPAYHYDEQSPSPIKWPAEYDDAALFYEWTRDWVRGMFFSEQGELTRIGGVDPAFVLANPIDMEFGPDGALYVLEYGEGYFSVNPGAQLSRIEYRRP